MDRKRRKASIAAVLALAVGTAMWIALFRTPPRAPELFALEDGANSGDIAAMQALARGRKGVVVWESRRPSGTENLKYRIWKRNLDGSGLAMISGAVGEADYAHLGPRISPDGRRVVFAGKRWNSSKDSSVQTLWDDNYVAPPFDAWLVEIDPNTLEAGEPRELLELHGRVGTAGEDRIFEWKDVDTLLVSIPDSRGIFEFDTTNGTLGRTAVGGVATEMLASPSERLVFSAAGRGAGWAYVQKSGSGTAEAGELIKLGGCQVSVSSADDCLLWINQDGPKLDRLMLSTAVVSDVPGITDMLPSDHNYIYFPALSRDRTLFAIGGSGYAGKDFMMRHSHAYADYEIFLFPWDPDACRPSGPPVRYTFNDRSRYPGVNEKAGHVLDRWPDVWVEHAKGIASRDDSGSAVVAHGEPESAASLASTVLPEISRRLASASQYSSILDDLEHLQHTADPTRASEASRLRAAIEQKADTALARARESESASPSEAVGTYRDIRHQFRGHRWALAAAHRVEKLRSQPELLRELDAWTLLEALRRTEDRLRDVPGAPRSAADDRFAKANAHLIRKMRTLAQRIGSLYPATRANAIAGSVMARYGLAPANTSEKVVAVVDAVVTRTSNPQALLADKQYPEGLICTEYKVTRVVSGKILADKLVTLQLARKGDVLLAPARFTVGETKRLTLGDWNAQTEYKQHKIADDIQDLDSPLYFVFKADPLKGD